MSISGYVSLLMIFVTNNTNYRYIQGQNVEPISGLSSEGYKGKGMVQSKPAKFVRHTDPEEE